MLTRPSRCQFTVLSWSGWTPYVPEYFCTWVPIHWFRDINDVILWHDSRHSCVSVHWGASERWWSVKTLHNRIDKTLINLLPAAMSSHSWMREEEGRIDTALILYELFSNGPRVEQAVWMTSPSLIQNPYSFCYVTGIDTEQRSETVCGIADSYRRTFSKEPIKAQQSLYVHSQILRSAHTVYLCVLCGSENKQRLFLYTAFSRSRDSSVGTVTGLQTVSWQ